MTKQHFTEVLLDYFEGNDLDKIELLDCDIFHQGLIDSFGIISLAAHLEEQFDFTFSPDDFTYHNFSRIRNIANICSVRSKTISLDARDD